MNVAEVTEPRWKAREKYVEYLRAVKERHTDEYEALKNAYRELDRGRKVIDLIATMRMAGVDTLYRPKLAIGRADQKFCWFGWRGNMPVFSPVRDVWDRRKNRHVISMPFDVFNVPLGQRINLRTNRALTPSVPPALLPKGQLSNYFILWEAEWETVPADPMLLRHLGLNLYLVLAHWDLTDLERAVLATRLPGGGQP